MIDALLLNLRSRDSVSDIESEVLASVIGSERRFATGEDIVAEGTRPGTSTVLLEGMSARYKVLSDGTRQITALHVPGDFIDLHAFLLKTMDHGIVAMSPCQVATVDHSDLRRITEEQPHLARLLWLVTVIDGAIHREWIVAMGRRSKKAHLAHLICELFVRLQVVRRTIGFSFQFPLTQVEVADSLGLSLVHLNKTLQSLRKEGAFVWENRTISIVDWSRLQSLAGFDPTYLDFNIEPR